MKYYNKYHALITDCLGNINIKCGSGECINSLSRCNNLVDCIDGSDEKNCTCAEFLRAQYLTRKICDGVVDCWDFSDENNCGTYTLKYYCQGWTGFKCYQQISWSTVANIYILMPSCEGAEIILLTKAHHTPQECL